MKSNTEIIKEELLEHLDTQMRQLRDFGRESAEGTDSHSSQLLLFSMLDKLTIFNKPYSILIPGKLMLTIYLHSQASQFNSRIESH